MSPVARFYCYICRRSLSQRSFDLEGREASQIRVCQDCANQLQRQGLMVSEVVIESERMIQLTLQSREGGEREVETPVGFIDLVTDEHAIEIKHVSDWKDGTKVLIYALSFPDRKPRVHLFGGYTAEFRQMVEKCYSALNVVVTWEREPF